jgi:hypothetical protein
MKYSNKCSEYGFPKIILEEVIEQCHIKQKGGIYDDEERKS